jgi:hypothetical protein
MSKLRRLVNKKSPSNKKVSQPENNVTVDTNDFEAQDQEFFIKHPYLTQEALDEIDPIILATNIQKDFPDLLKEEGEVESNKILDLLKYVVTVSLKPKGLGKYWHSQEAVDDDLSRAKLFSVGNSVDSLFFMLFVAVKTAGWGAPLLAFYIAWFTGNVFAQESAKPGRSYVGFFNIVRSFGLSLGGGLYFVTMAVGQPIAELVAYKQASLMLPQVQEMAATEETELFGGTISSFKKSCFVASRDASRQETVKNQGVGRMLFTKSTLEAYGTFTNSKRLEQVRVAEGTLTQAVRNGTIKWTDVQGSCFKLEVAEGLSASDPKWQGPNMIKLQRLQGVQGIGSQLYILGGVAAIKPYQLTDGEPNNLGVSRIVDPYMEVSALVSNFGILWQKNFYGILMAIIGTLGITGLTAALTWYYSKGGESYWAYRSHMPIGLDHILQPKLKSLTGLNPIVVDLVSDEALGLPEVGSRVLRSLSAASKQTSDQKKWLPKAMTAMMIFLQSHSHIRNEWETLSETEQDAAYNAVKACISRELVKNFYSACVRVVDFAEFTWDEKIAKAFELLYV